MKSCFAILACLSTVACAAETSLETGIVASMIRIQHPNGSPVCFAVAVSEQGYVVTKASEVRRLAELRFLQEATGQVLEVSEVYRDAGLDLVLLRVDEPSDLKVPSWNESKSLSLGQWLLASHEESGSLRAGVVSARRRPIPSSGVAIGIRTDPAEMDKGVRIDFVIPESPAAHAGLKADDVVLAVAGEVIVKGQGIRDLIGRRTPGDEVEILFRRSGKESRCMVRVASRDRIEAKLTDDDYANGGVSLRSDRFPEVIQHDIPLAPTDMGGPLLNLQGQAVGINIARVDRVTTFALPTEVFLPQIENWIREDKARRTNAKP